MLPDGKTLVGGTPSGSLKVEDITGKDAPLEIDNQGSLIKTMIFNQRVNSLLVGYLNGCVTQFKKDSSGNLRKEKRYGNVGVECVYANDCSGDFAVVGGKNGRISLINMRSRTVITMGMQTAIWRIFSLQFCRVSETEMHLAVGGTNRDYSHSKTDLFDVSELFNLDKGKSERAKILELSKKVESMTEKINKLHKNLRLERTQKNEIIRQNQQLNEANHQLRKTIQKEKQKKKKTRSKNEKLDQDNQKLESKNKVKRKKIKSLKSNLKSVEKVNVKLPMKITMHLKKSVEKMPPNRK